MLAPLSTEQIDEDWWDDAECRDGEASLSGVFFSCLLYTSPSPRD